MNHNTKETEPFEYRENEFFNENDTYLFERRFDETNPSNFFESKVHYDKGYWWTNESLNYKATTIRCKKV